MKHLFLTALVVLSLIGALPANAAKLMGLTAIDNRHLMLHFRDGEVRYRDDGTGPSAYLGHSFAPGDDTLRTFAPRLNTAAYADASQWTVTTTDSRGRTRKAHPKAVWRKSKPMNTDHRLISELDHWLFLQLDKPMADGTTVSISIPADLGSDMDSASMTFSARDSQSEAIHVNTIGYHPDRTANVADLYLWLGEGGPRDYSSFEGNTVWLLNTATGELTPAGSVKFWRPMSDHSNEAGQRNLTGSDVWTADFATGAPGTYRLVVDGVGCSQPFEVKHDVYREPFSMSTRGYYYMRLGEPVDTPRVQPIPRQPRFLSTGPDSVTVYLTDLHPWHPEWRKLRMDVWDEPHFKAPEQSIFYAHRLPGNPTSRGAVGGHSDAFDWDRHLAHVSNIYDMLLSFILTDGRPMSDNLGIRESGNGIPDIIDEARNEVDFFLSIRDGEAYSQGVTNPSADWTTMFQAGCTTMAAWANAANCAMLAEALRISGHADLAKYYTDEAIRAYNFAGRQKDKQEDDAQHVGDVALHPRDFRHLAAACLYNLTGDRSWENAMINNAATSKAQWWGIAAALKSPRASHFPAYLEQLKEYINAAADSTHLAKQAQRPSRRAADDPRHRTSENVDLLLMAHAIATTPERRAALEDAMLAEASWCLGRNPANIVEMTGLGTRHLTDVYSTGRNDGFPGTHPGQTPFNGTETWSAGNGGDARILLTRCYPAWQAGWPEQESFFNQRYMWVNAEFTPRETMRGKMALLAYLHALEK